MQRTKSKREKFRRSAHQWENGNAVVYSAMIKTIRSSPLRAPICSISNNWTCYGHTTLSILIRMSTNYTRSPNGLVWVSSMFNIGSMSCVRATQRQITSNRPSIHSFHQQQQPVETTTRRRPPQRTQQPHLSYRLLTTICVHRWWLLRPRAILLSLPLLHFHSRRSLPIHHANKPNHWI